MTGAHLGDRGDTGGAFSVTNGRAGALVLHGFTGSPASMRPLAETLADADFTVELPLLPGHGTSPEDLASATFEDWRRAASDALGHLTACCERTVVVGLSMGGTLALRLALDNPDLAGLVLINPLVKPAAPSMIEILTKGLEAGVTMMPTIGSDLKRAGVATGGYDATPVAALLSLLGALEEVSSSLERITCPILLLSSRTDHVVPPESGDLVEERVAGPLERVFLENSFHVATLDNDAAELEERSVAFALKVVA